jgi:hypothetical protein
MKIVVCDKRFFFFFATVPSRFSFKTTGLHAIGFVQRLRQWKQQPKNLVIRSFSWLSPASPEICQDSALKSATTASSHTDES